MDFEEKAIEFAQEQTKQFISLASAIPALMITFSKDFVSPLAPTVKNFAFYSWGFFLMSVFFGLLTLMALTGALANRAAAQIQASAEKSTFSKIPLIPSNARVYAAIQVITFFIGLVLVVIFGWKAS